MSKSIDTHVETKAQPTEVPIVNVVPEATENNTNNTPTQEVPLRCETDEQDNLESEFNRATVEALSNRIRLVDNDEEAGLDLFCYVSCGPTDTGLIRKCRGVVFNGEDVVMKAFPYTVEYNNTETKLIDENITPHFDRCQCYDAHEGALIRMFYFSGKWYTSTHRKLNAFRSKWASRESFGTSFKRALESEVDNNKVLRESLPDGDENLLERFQSTLDQDKQYMFLIRNTSENRIVCQPPERPTLYHVGTFVEGELVMTDDIKVPYPKKHSFSSIDELYSYVEKVDPRDLQGVIIFAPDNLQYKILQKDYQEFFRARGNEPSIKFRYLQVRMNKKYVDMLYHLYPDMADTFDDYENVMYDVANSIYCSYVQRFIKKRYVTVPREEFAVIRECHSWHEQDRAENRINLNKVIEILNLQTPTNLNRMQRRFRTEQLRLTENPQDTQDQKSPSIESLTPKASPLLLLKNRKKNPLPLPLPINLGEAVVKTEQPRERVLSTEVRSTE